LNDDSAKLEYEKSLDIALGGIIPKGLFLIDSISALESEMLLLLPLISY
jgi:hypothetical protein